MIVMRALAIALLFGSVLLAAEARDLSQYDVIGPFTIDYVRSFRETEPMDAQVRDFLWSHWRQHRRGTVFVIRRYVDGAFRLSYFIEPDQRGDWAIVQYTEDSFLPLRANKGIAAQGLGVVQLYMPRSQMFSCTQFERVEPDRPRLPLIRIPESETRKAERYLLHPTCSKEDENLW